MKRFGIIFGIVVLIAAIAYPVLAWGPGWGRGYKMTGNWGGGQGYCWRFDKGYGNLTQEQQSALEQINRKFSNETATLRNRIQAKWGELNTVLSAPDPDAEKAMALQREISDLRSQLSEKQLAYQLEARKIAPGAYTGSGYRKGYRRHMMGYDPGMGYGSGMRGYGSSGRGPGPCWN